MTFKGLLLFLVVFLIVRAVRKAMRRPEPALSAPGSVRGAVPGKAKSAGPSSAPRSEASAGSKSSVAGEPSAQRAGQAVSDAAEEARSPHEVLGVEPGASADEVRAAYQRLARSYHPDRVEGLAPELRELAHKRMVEINRAFEALSRGDATP